MARASLTSSRDFRRVYRSGRRARDNGITVWAVRRDDDGDARLGMAIRASAGTAVERNRVRRRVRAIFRGYAPETGRDVVVQATGDTTGKTFQELEEILGVALGRAGVRSLR